MDVPQTVTAALEDRPVDGNATAGLLANGARRIYRRSRPSASGSFERASLSRDDETPSASRTT